jgi:hypothetical protein
MLGRDRIAKAERLFDRGAVDDAAWMLWEERRTAIQASDADRLAEIDEVSTVMRERLEGDFRLPAFDAYLAGREAPAASSNDSASAAAAEPEVDVTPISLGIALVGAGLMLVATFLPQFESNTFAQIEKNSLIQNGDGWWFILLAVLASGAAYRAYRGNRRTFAPVAFGAIGIALAVYYGTSHSQRRLCSAISSGTNCTLGNPGIGIYAAGVGALLVAIGGWQIFRSQALEADGEQPAVTPTSRPVASSTIADRLRTLDQLRADGLITNDEHARRRSALIDEV